MVGPDNFLPCPPPPQQLKLSAQTLIVIILKIHLSLQGLATLSGATETAQMSSEECTLPGEAPGTGATTLRSARCDEPVKPGTNKESSVHGEAPGTGATMLHSAKRDEPVKSCTNGER